MQNAHLQKYTVYIIIRCKRKKSSIFVGGGTHENPYLENTIKSLTAPCFQYINEVFSSYHGNSIDTQGNRHTHIHTHDYRDLCACAEG